MRYKTLVTSKLDSTINLLNRLYSQLSQNPTREQIDETFAKIKERLEEIQTLVNTEPESI